MTYCGVLEMTEFEPGRTPRSSKSKRVARKIAEIITAFALLVAILYWPTTNEGRVYLIAAGVVWFVGLVLLSKWPSN